MHKLELLKSYAMLTAAPDGELFCWMKQKWIDLSSDPRTIPVIIVAMSCYESWRVSAVRLFVAYL